MLSAVAERLFHEPLSLFVVQVPPFEAVTLLLHVFLGSRGKIGWKNNEPRHAPTHVKFMDYCKRPL